MAFHPVLRYRSPRGRGYGSLPARSVGTGSNPGQRDEPVPVGGPHA